MIRLKIGDFLHPGISGYEEGVHYNYSLGGHTLTIATKDASLSEISAVQVRQSMFALEIVDEAIILLSKFGGSPWRFSHYNWWINAPAMRPDPLADLENLHNGVLWINVCVVNSSSGFVEALRTVYLSHEFSFLLLRNVELQTRYAFDPCHYLDVIERTTRKFRDTNSVTADAVCMCAGDVFLWDYDAPGQSRLYN
ncbi:MAG: hypothetical protein ACP5VS_03410 [Desulfomonilaceae bacterium]